MTESSALAFPANFIWGSATASYQIGGAVHEDGRGDSIWDAFARTPGKTYNGDTGEHADDHYHRLHEDVQLLQQLGFRYYRFSIAWPRIIPAGVGVGDSDSDVNERGVAFYNRLIDELLARDITPLVTLYHWDLPLALQVEHDGWLNGPVIQDAFVEYARVCFERFGDRVKHWLTLNEPWCAAVLGYGCGTHAPGRKSNGHIEAYQSAHNMLLAHARAVELYRREFKPKQHGQIGITLNCDWREPKAATDPKEVEANQQASERALMFMLGHFADPVYLGDYPKLLKDILGDRLPTFTDDEKKLIKGSSDFFGLNTYSTTFVTPAKRDKHAKAPTSGADRLWYEYNIDHTYDPEWVKTDNGWNVVPWGFEKLLLWIQHRYNPPNGILVTENGCADFEKSKEEATNDQLRVNYFKGYLTAMHHAMQQGADVRGYFAWSFMDNFEWDKGYSKRFGLCWVDYTTFERTPKKSALWFRDLMKANAVPK